MADSGTLTVTDDSKFRAQRKITVTWQCGAGVPTLEKTLNLNIRGEIRAISHKPGGTPPTVNSDLNVFLEEDAAMAGAIVAAAGDGLDLVSTAFKHKPLTTPPIVHGKIRLQILNNAVNDANGTFFFVVRNAQGPGP